MLPATTVHPEGPRYRTPLVFLPGLWAGPAIWRPMASYLAHRGWAGTAVDLRAIRGGIDARGRAVADFVAGLPSPPALVGHDAGALVALAAACHARVAALVLVAPLVPGSAETHALVWSWRLVWAALRRRPSPPPGGPMGLALAADLPAAHRRDLGLDDAGTIAEVGRRRRLTRPAVMPPTLVLHGGRDPLLPSAGAARLVRELGADASELPAAHHWPLLGPSWQACVRLAHTWLVRRLGEPLLELYEEAMAERDDGEDVER